MISNKFLFYKSPLVDMTHLCHVKHKMCDHRVLKIAEKAGLWIICIWIFFLNLSQNN